MLLCPLIYILASLLNSVTAITYLFSFGDSYTDTGFENTGVQPSASNPLGNPAYGTSQSSSTRGTWSGGPNYIDFLTTEHNNSLVLSYNFAYGGATISDSIVPAAGYIHTLQEQVEQYYEPKYSVRGGANDPWLSKDAIFSIFIGINDIDNSFATTNPATQVPRLLNAYFQYVDNLYGTGARKFLFIGVPPVDRSPPFSGNAQNAATLSKFINYYNGHLAGRINGWAAAHTDATTSIYDFHAFMTQVLNSPTSYGFQDATCSGVGDSNCIWWAVSNLHTTSHFQELVSQNMLPALAKLGW